MANKLNDWDPDEPESVEDALAKTRMSIASQEQQRKDSADFMDNAFAIVGVVVAILIMALYLIHSYSQREACAGIMLKDAYGIPTCVESGAVPVQSNQKRTQW